MMPPKLPARGEAALTELFGQRRPTRWVTREHPKIDRIACPWAIRRFIDPHAEIIYTPTDKVFATAERERAIAFDNPGAPISHDRRTLQLRHAAVALRPGGCGSRQGGAHRPRRRH